MLVCKAAFFGRMGFCRREEFLRGHNERANSGCLDLIEIRWSIRRMNIYTGAGDVYDSERVA